MEKFGFNDVKCIVNDYLLVEVYEEEEWYVNKKEKNNDNVSDDDRYVFNGYDVVVDIYKDGEEFDLLQKEVLLLGNKAVNGSNRYI